MKPTILIVDDDENLRTEMRWSLVDDYEVLQAEDRATAMELYREERPLVTLLDLGLPPSPNTPEEGLRTLSEILEAEPRAKVIVVTGQGEKENALKAIGAGACDFLCKPSDPEQLQLMLERYTYVAELEREYEQQEGEMPDSFEGIVGSCPAMQKVYVSIRKVAKSIAPVLILGESGTGKEMVAKAIHSQSPRKSKPFMAINCNAIPEELIESELFGHEKGAFTGANAQRKGLIEGAEGGTLFLDEIGDLPGAVQVKLLRFLQEKTLQRVGGREEISIDTRILAATNVDLEKAIGEGSFREDLYFRLAVVLCHLPPLRERGGDVGLLAQEFLRFFAEENGKSKMSFTKEALAAIFEHNWPGNVRELQNRVQRAVIMAEGRQVDAEDLDLEAPEGKGGTTLREARENVEREMVEKAVRKHGGNMTAVAADLGISRPTLYELMGKLGLSRNSGN